MAGIVVKPRARILHGHDWVFSSEVLKVFGKPADGDVISLKDGKDRLIGSAIYNSKSQIVARRFSRRKQNWTWISSNDASRKRQNTGRDAVSIRNSAVLSGAKAMDYRELIIDRYGDHFVMQTLTLAMDMRRDLLADAIIDLFGNARSSSEMTRLFGKRKDWNCTQAFCAETVHRKSRSKSKDVKFEIDLLHGQKTGFYLDQKHNYSIVAEFASGRRVLDCFTNQGAFALTCARAGAADVIGVEKSAENIAGAKSNAVRNDLKVRWIEQDVFQFLRATEKAEAQYDLIVLDPPSFTKTRSGLHDALRGYRELHVRAFKFFRRMASWPLFHAPIT